MNICLEGPNGNWDWFDARLTSRDLGLNLNQVRRVCGTDNPMVIDIEYDEDEPYVNILSFDGMGYTPLSSLISQAEELSNYDEDDLEKIAIYMRTKEGDLEYALQDYDNHFYVNTDDSDPTSLAYLLISEDGVDNDLASRYFDYTSFGRDLLLDGYETDETDEYTVGEEYIDGVYGGIDAYIDAVGLDEATRYFDFDEYGRTLGVDWTYDDVSGKWISESIHRGRTPHRFNIKESSRSNKKYTGRTWSEFIKDLESNSIYKVDSAYRRRYDQWIELIDRDGNIYDAEVTQYYPSGYELLDYNITPSYQYNESLNPKISDTQIRLVMNRAANLRDYDELDSVISSLLSIDKDLYRKYSEMYRTRKVSAAYMGKEISDELYYLLKN